MHRTSPTSSEIVYERQEICAGTYRLNAPDLQIFKTKEARISWIMIVIAGVFEIAFAIDLKYSNGFTRIWPTIGTAIALLISMVPLSAAVRSRPVGTTYAVWTEIGAVGTAILGIFVFGDAVNPARVFFLICIGTGVIGLKFA